jgi:protein-tyrosine phosphatase
MSEMVGGDSRSNPLRVDWLGVADLSVTGRLGRTFLPGKNHHGVSGMLHARSARLDAQRLRDEYRVDTLLLLNEDHEIARFVNDVPPPAGPQNLMAALAENSIALLRLPIPDGGVPRPNQEDELRALLTDVVALLRAGKNVAVACRGGIGRTGTLLGLVLIELGCFSTSAIVRVRAMKPECIDPGRQEEYVRSWRTGSGVS